MPGVCSVSSVTSHNKVSTLEQIAESSPMRWDSSLKEFLETPHKENRLFVCYAASPEHDPAKTPRTHKAADTQILAALDFNLLALDIDNHEWCGGTGKVPWTPALLHEWQEDILPGLWANLPHWQCIYYTNNGCRVIYEYESPIDLDTHQRRLAGMLKQWEGIADQACKDWTRLFYAPRIPKTSATATIVWTGEAPPATWPVAEPHQSLHSVAIQVTPNAQGLDEPTREFVQSLLGDKKWFSAAKRRSTGRDYYKHVFDSRYEGQPLAEPGARDQTIVEMVGSAVGVLRHVSGTTPEHVYSLLYRSVENMEPDDDDPHKDWHTVLWDVITRFWDSDEAKQVKEVKEAKEGRYLLLDSITSKIYVRLKEDGAGYRQDPVKKEFLVATIKYHNLPLSLVKLGPMGMTPKSSQDLMNEYGFPIAGVCTTIGQRGHQLVEQGGRWRLQFSMYQLRSDLTPKHIPKVHEWLRRLFGDDLPKISQWIGHALDFGKPTAALSAVGEAGVGKSMFAEGLASVLQDPCVASDRELTQEWQPSLGRTPFLVINEGFSVTRGKRTVDVADSFRSWVAGDTMSVNVKYMAHVTIKNPLRIVITANNYQSLMEIFGYRDLSPADREAIRCRVMHVDLKPCAKWLNTVDTTGWVDDGLIAQHFLHLHKVRTLATRNSRFLVEGDLAGDLYEEMKVRTGAAAVVVETVARMLHDHQKPRGMQVGNRGSVNGASTTKPKVWVTSAGVRDYFYKDLYKQHKAGLTVRSIGMALSSLGEQDCTETATIYMPDGSKSRRYRWRNVDAEVLYRECVKLGLPYDRLTPLLDFDPTKEDSCQPTTKPSTPAFRLVQ